MTDQEVANAEATLRVALADYKAAPAGTLAQWRALATLEASCTPEVIEHLLGLMPRDHLSDASKMVAPQPSAAAKAGPDMRAICEALGFDPTNHHNAAKCPYCRPAEPPRAREVHRCIRCDYLQGHAKDCPNA